jgi:iron complex outermembrane recepter protein
VLSARRISAVTLAGLCFGIGGVAHGEGFDVPAGPLGQVVATLGEQADATVAVTDPEIAAQPSPGVHGDFPLRVALDYALRGTDAEPVFYDKRTVRIIRSHKASAASKAPLPDSTPVTTGSVEEIVVTASKQNILADDFPGSVKLVALDPGWVASNAQDGTDAITKLLPVLGSTNLGPGRDKLFIRGIADSSFNGPTQATAGQYLGDVRLNYNGPDPDLDLYDMQRIEVLVGPQGTLYGAGSLGGVIRVTPNPPDTHEIAATAAATLGSTEFGGIGSDGSGMLNLPLVDDRLAARFVVFGGHQAGYIDDPSRRLDDINATSRSGERFSLRTENWSDWTIDMGFVQQNIADADGQYTVRGAPPLTRNSAIPQPFHNDYRLGYITARQTSDDVDLVSTTSVSMQNLSTVFDATGYDGTSTPARFEEDNDTTLISHETRISGTSWEAPWVAGGSAVFNSSTLSRTLGPLDAQKQITGVVNIQAEAALFGQISYPLTDTLTGTVGERLTFSNSTGFLIEKIAEGSQKSSRDESRFSGTLALDWHPGGALSAFFHYQEGNRAGGLAVAPSGSGLVSQKFVADELDMDEVGIRLGNEARDTLSLRSAIFFADWNNIQADLVDKTGLPYTANIGRGRLYGIDGTLTWRLSPELTISADAFVNDSKLYAPDADFAVQGTQPLPNVARDGGRVAAAWSEEIAPGVTLSGETSVRFVGKSNLGVGPLLDIPQGGYFDADAGARLDFNDFGLSLALDNIADARANTFAFGNPFSLGQRNQMTPLRPRTIRLGANIRF